MTLDKAWVPEETPLFGRHGKPYDAEPGLRMAANVALALSRPLLVTGEPGCGKTDFAWAMAGALSPAGAHVPPLECYIRSDTRARDLLYSYDALLRLGDTHHGGPEGAKRASLAHNYVRLEALGQALVGKTRRVVLIDEIDKAPRDLPNDLLRELDQGTFTVHEIPEGQPSRPIAGQEYQLERHMGADRGGRSLRPRPFVLITSNVERHLPDAFLRRCVFWHITALNSQRLRDILASRFDSLDAALLDAAAEVFSGVRNLPGMTKPPATAELIDWVSALQATAVHQKQAVNLRSFADLLRRGLQSHDWLKVPGLGCLVKSQDDLRLLTG